MSLNFEKFREQEQMRKGLIISRDEAGYNKLTPEYVSHVCVEKGGFHTAHLNTCLYLHHKGFRKLEAIEAFTEVRTLWLECNGLMSISGFEHLKEKLYMLFLQQNILEKIEGLSGFAKLVCLNLSHNKITKIEGLEGCVSLKNFDLSHNPIQSILDCEQLKELPALTSLDLRQCQIDDDAEIIPFFTEMLQLIALYLKGCPAIRKISGYRKNMTIAVPTLGYLDERPIFESERLMADAFARGGKEEEEKVRVVWAEKQKMSTKASTEHGKKISEESRIKRKIHFKQMMEEVKIKRKDLIDNYWDTKRELDAMPEANAEHQPLRLKLTKVMELMQEEWFLKIRQEGDGGEITPEMGKPHFKSEKSFLEDMEKRKNDREEKENQRNTEEYKQTVIDMLQAQTDRDREAGNGIKAKNVVPEASSGSDEERQPLQEREVNFHPNEEKKSSPAVSGTSSEEDDQAEYGPGWIVKNLSQVRWSPKLEHALEDIMLRNQFDFKKSAKDFQKHLNRTEGTSDTVFSIDSKTLQLRWTDIEIRKHVIPAQQAEARQADSEQSKDYAQIEEDEEDLPPLEEPTLEEKQAAMAKQTSSKLINNLDPNSSSGEENTNDLEELD